MYIYTCTYMYLYIYMYICIFINTCSHSYVYLHIYNSTLGLHTSVHFAGAPTKRSSSFSIWSTCTLLLLSCLFSRLYFDLLIFDFSLSFLSLFGRFFVFVVVFIFSFPSIAILFRVCFGGCASRTSSSHSSTS